jgi:hypothetical protein
MEAKFRANDAGDVKLGGNTAFLEIMEQVEEICQLQNLNTEFILMI